MNLDFYISSLSGGGAERVLTALANESARRGNTVRIISLEKRKQFYIPDESIEIVRAETYEKKITQIYRDFSLIRQCLRDQKNAVAVSFLSRCNILVLLGSLFSSNKVVVCDRNNPRMEHSRLVFLASQVLYLLLADRVMVQTQEIKSMYLRALQKKILVIENPVDLDALGRQICGEETSRDAHRMISMGRLEGQKDFKTLIRAFSQLTEKYPDWNLDIYGIGSDEEILRKFIAEKGLNDRVKLRGQTSRPFLEMKRSSIFVLSSFYEGFPNVLCEALCAGCVCIASDCVSGPSELIEEGENGFLFPVGDADQLSRKLESCMNGQMDLEPIRRNAEKSVSRLEKGKIMNAWMSVLEDLSGER